MLKGALRTLRTHRPWVIFEHEGAAREYDTTAEEIWDMLSRDAGLRVFDLDGDGPYERHEFCSGGRLVANHNWLARP